MDLSTLALFGLVALIGANQMLMRIPRLRKDLRLFWALNVLDLLAGAAVLVLGLPGYEHAPVVGWVVGLMLLMHIAQNMHQKYSWEQEEREAAQMERELERKRRRQDREEEEGEP